MARHLSHNIFEKHNHRHCRVSAMSDARDLCAGENLRLTPIRARVLEILLESHKAMGAYEILERLQAEGHRGQPPVVYRALEFLVAHGLAHRLERLNAFVACNHVGAGHGPIFLICEVCQRVAEAPLGPLAGEIDTLAAGVGFTAASRVVEISGLCPACHAGGRA